MGPVNRQNSPSSGMLQNSPIGSGSIAGGGARSVAGSEFGYGDVVEAHRQHHHSPFAHGDSTSPGVAQHKMRNNSNASGPYLPFDRENSMGGSSVTSPGLSLHMMNDMSSHPHNDDGTNKSGDGGPPPSWSEMKTKAGKERKRLPLACIACRRKKIRCSGETPACNHCLRSRIPCVYLATTRKAAPRTDYMVMLDKRLKRMEERVIKILPKEDQGIVVRTGRSNVKPPLPGAVAKSTPSTKKRPADQAFDNELEGWSKATLKTAPDEARTTANSEAEASSNKDAAEHNLLVEGIDKLPSQELQQHLAETYFEYVYGQSYPLLHKPSFMRRLAHGAVPPVLTLAVCAISARFSNHPELRTEPAFLRGECWAAPAREIALRRYDTPNITILIVYLILGLHEFGTCQGGRSWMLGGMAQRMAYALQLHQGHGQEPEVRNADGKQESLSTTDQEIRRRTMWSCFLMDRFNSSGTERPFFIGEQYIRARLPIQERFFQMEIRGPTEALEGIAPHLEDKDPSQVSDARANMGVAAHTIRLVYLWGRISHYLNLGGKKNDAFPMWKDESEFQAINRAVQRWRKDLPSVLAYTPENLQNHASERIANQFLFMHMIHNQIILFMYRFALPSPGTHPAFSKDMPAEFLKSSATIAIDAASRMSALVNEAMDHAVVAPFAGYCAYYSSTVHVYGAFSGNTALETISKQALAWNVKFLSKMKKYWGMFHVVTENLRDLYRRHADAARGATASNDDKDENDTGIFQYGDWFGRYPHGVSGFDFEGPAGAAKEPGADGVLGKGSDLQTVEEFFSKLTARNRLLQASNQSAKPTKKKKRNKVDPKKAAASGEEKSMASGETTAKATNASQDENVPADSQQVEMADTSPEQIFPEHISQTDPSSEFFPPTGLPPFAPFNGPNEYMSQLDRQMVLNSFTGFDASMSSAPPQLDSSGVPFDSYGQVPFSGLPDTLNQPGISNGPGAGVWGDPSTAWFMPFNMNPPNLIAQRDPTEVFGDTEPTLDWAAFGAAYPPFPPDSGPPQPQDLDLNMSQANLNRGNPGSGPS